MAETTDSKRLRAAVHYGVNEACKSSTTPLSKECVALITELTLRQAEMMAHDLECFSQHAKRSTITGDDVLLCARRNPSLQDCLREKQAVLPGASKRKSKQKAG